VRPVRYVMPNKDSKRGREAEARLKANPGRNVSWVPGRKGQGGEGLSKGLGGSGGDGTGPSGPEEVPASRKRGTPKPSR